MSDYFELTKDEITDTGRCGACGALDHMAHECPQDIQDSEVLFDGTLDLIL